jgi:hypothetical protein
MGGEKVGGEDEERKGEGGEDKSGEFDGPNVNKLQKTDDILTATRPLRGWAPEVAPPKPQKFAVKKSEEMCQIQFNQTLKNISPKINPKLNRYLVATKKTKSKKKHPKDRLAYGGRCISP